MRVAACLGPLLLAGALASQQLLWERAGVPAVISLGGNSVGAGGQVVNLGDFDRDGCDDLLVSGADLVAYRAQLWILSGKDGSTLRAGPVAPPWYFYETIGAAGDLDGDGTPDYTLRVRHQLGLELSRIEARSGRDDSVLWQVVQPPGSQGFGAALLGKLDLDADGRPDVVLTSLYVNGERNGGLFAYRHDGTPLWEIAGTAQQPIGMVGPLGRIGDFDRDGAGDLVVCGWDVPRGAGAVLVLSGRTGRELVRGIAPAGVLLDACDGCGDLDGDGVPDFAGGTYAPGLVLAFSGKTGAELYRWQALSLGTSLKGGGIDFDLDGVPDLVAGAPYARGTTGREGVVFAYSGRDGSELLRAERPWQLGGSSFGGVVEVLSPQPGNPFPLVAISDPQHLSWGTGYLGKIAVYRGAPPSVQPLGQACAGAREGAPRAGITGLGPLGARMHLSGAEPGVAAVLAVGLSSTTWAGAPLPLALDPFGFSGCSLHTSIELSLPVTTGRHGLAAGYAAFDLPVRLAGLLQITLHGQWLVLGTAPNATAALSWQH